ncbi:MAG: hypothetical protein OEZ20_04485 [candidate division WOR-3 bacterium]|nr:hypothetical protein [candidate division WOR-3 bacterium]
MTTIDKNNTSLEPWEEELFAMHRWGRFAFWFKKDDPKGKQELKRLRGLWDKAKPIDESLAMVMKQIMSLEICNWKLEESILEICASIGTKTPSKQGIGHMASMTEERWKKIWAYYLTLRKWLSSKGNDSYDILLKTCDPDKIIQDHVIEMLGDRNKIKELYVERFGLSLERWLGDYSAPDSPQLKAHQAAILAVDSEIKKVDPENTVIHELVLKNDGDGRLNLCNHKLFRRYDIIISSIGVGNWRGAMGKRGTDGLERADILEKYLSPIESWIQGRESDKNELSNRIHNLLDKQDAVKKFLASLFVSLLRSQQLAARKLAKQRQETAT